MARPAGRYTEVGDARALGFSDTGLSPAGQAQAGNWSCHFGTDDYWSAGANYGGRIAVKLTRFRVYQAQVTGPIGAWFTVWRGLRQFTTANLQAAGATGVQCYDPVNPMPLAAGVELWFTFSAAYTLLPAPAVTLWFDAPEEDLVR